MKSKVAAAKKSSKKKTGNENTEKIVQKENSTESEDDDKQKKENKNENSQSMLEIQDINISQSPIKSSVETPQASVSTPQPTASPPVKATKKRSKQKTLYEGDEIDLQTLMQGSYILKEGTWITNCFLEFDRIKPFYPSSNAQKPTRAYYYFNVFDSFGNKISELKIKRTHELLQKKNSVQQFYLAATGIGKLMKAIQTAKVGGFPKITILAEEKSVTFRKSVDTHYYLGMVIGDPNSPLSLSSNHDQIAACANCDVMLLRFGFDWVLQRDDLRQMNCPYCNAPLKINYRNGKIIKLDLNLNETGCIIDGGNNQLGVMYHGHAIKTTIWAHGLLNFLKNYQNFFPNKSMGPVKIKLNMNNPEEIQEIEPQTLLNIEWRPIELFPEDFMAF